MTLMVPMDNLCTPHHDASKIWEYEYEQQKYHAWSGLVWGIHLNLIYHAVYCLQLIHEPQFFVDYKIMLGFKSSLWRIHA